MIFDSISCMNVSGPFEVLSITGNCSHKLPRGSSLVVRDGVVLDAVVRDGVVDTVRRVAAAAGKLLLSGGGTGPDSWATTRVV